MLTELYWNWRIAMSKAATARKERRVAANAKRVARHEFLKSFVDQTRPLVPRASVHPDAALYRHVWKRAVVLKAMCEANSQEPAVEGLTKMAELGEMWSDVANVAAQRYYACAPETLYGKRKLELSPDGFARVLDDEKKYGLLKHLWEPKRTGEPRPYACIYMGTCEKGFVYVGQTVGPLEVRAYQHRQEGTGPFKNGEQYVTWSVVEGRVDPTKLDELEAYYIGFYDSHKSGYNDTRGNDQPAYLRGQSDRQKKG